jgi:cytochrome c-type biogenesis protein CcmH
MSWLRALLLALCLATPVAAVSPDEILPDPVLEQRARDISAGLRCLVCQNQSIDDSDADLAKDLRVLVRERLVAGDSDEAVRQFLVDRYGEYVLLNPRLSNHTLLLWIAAPTLLLAGLGTLFVVGRKRRMVAAGLSAEERAALDELK